jgi:electron transfer flavoprotein beta subunit|tara:strand:+ start:193 stop:963 length:771 start_codon:yes stop_codon:yes gene_type:complete
MITKSIKNNPMKILVCISKSPDTTSKISFTENNTKFDEAGIQYIINPYDEWYALVRGIELKEANGGSVTTITVGTASDDPTIRKALAIGADNAVRIDAEAKDAFFVAKQIAEYAKDKAYDLVLLGKETISYNGAQVGGMVSELLDLPYISLASKLEINGTTASITRDAKGGDELVEANLPLTISASKGMAEQRIPNMRGIMAARSKPLTVVAPAEVTETVSTINYEMPPEKSGCKYVDANNMEELVDLLHNEAKVI